MLPGSVIVDLAAERGGNVELTKPNETVTTANGVTIIGYTNVPARLATSASQLFARQPLRLPRNDVRQEDERPLR